VRDGRRPSLQKPRGRRDEGTPLTTALVVLITIIQLKRLIAHARRESGVDQAVVRGLRATGIGQDAVGGYDQVSAAQLAEVDAWRAHSASTDFEG
jgi:hypothetical protein